jgi:hypothetical protein
MSQQIRSSDPSLSPALLPRRKTVLVVKRNPKSAKPSVVNVRRTTRPPQPSKGLPSLDTIQTATLIAAQARLQEDEEKRNAEIANVDDDDAALLLFANLPCETLMVIQSLLSHTQTSISIPLSSNGNQFVPAVLPCQLYKTLQQSGGGGGGGDVVVSRELQMLLANGTLVRLSSTFMNSDIQVLMRLQDYECAVRHIIAAVEESSRDSMESAVNWFVKHLKHWKTPIITEADFERVWSIKNNHNDSSATNSMKCSLEETLSTLCKYQVLMACRQSTSSYSSSTSYQLWLPTWGIMVLDAWNTARRKLVRCLKQSHYKERSEQALQQPYSPIPTSILIDWLEDQGCVERVERASGTFVKLTPG